MRKSLLLAIALACMLDETVVSQARATDAAPQRSVAEMSTGDWTVSTVVEDLDYPWDIEASGDRVFVTEAAGNIVVVQNGRARRLALQTSVSITGEGGGGLLGMALAPAFETSGTAYFYHSYRAVLSYAVI